MKIAKIIDLSYEDSRLSLKTSEKKERKALDLKKITY